MIKKFAALLLALSLCTGSLAGCAGKDDGKDSKAESVTAEQDTTAAEDDAGPAGPVQEEVLPVASLTVDGKEIDTANYTMMTVDGIDISFDEFRFYYFYNLDSYKQNYGVTGDALRDNQVAYNSFLSEVVRAIKQELVTDKLAAEHGIVLDDEDQQVVDNNMQNAKANYDSEEEFQKDMQRAHLTEEIYKKMFVRAQTYNKVMSTLFANDGEFATSHDDFLKMIQDPEQYAHEVHIMIPFYSQAELDDSTAEGYDELTLSQKIGAKSAAYSALDDEAKETAKQHAPEVNTEIPANGGLFANAKISADALKKLTESEDE